MAWGKFSRRRPFRSSTGLVSEAKVSEAKVSEAKVSEAKAADHT
jgi:hypothetical protein